MDTYLAVPVGVIDLWIHAVPVGVIDLWIHTLRCLLGLQTCGYIPCCACWGYRPVDTYLGVPVDLWINTLLCLLGPPWKLGL